MNTLLTTDEICKLLRVRRETLCRWRKCGLPFKRVMGSVRYDPIEIEEWISSQNENPANSKKDSGGDHNE